MRRSYLKSRPRRTTVTDEEREQMETFKLAVADLPCAVCGSGRYWMDAHHVVSQQQLRRDGLEQYMWDPRNALPLCPILGAPAGNGCHERHENASERVPRRCLTAENEQFAADLGLGWYLDRYYGLAA